MFGDDASFLRHRHTNPDIVKSARIFFFPDMACSRLRHSRVHGIEKTRTRKKKTGETPFFPVPPSFSRAFHIRVFPTLSRPPHYLRAWNGLFWIRFPSTRIWWIRHKNPQLLESALQSGIFLIRYESGIVWTLNPYVFLSGEVTRSSPVLYREYYVQDGNLVPRFS